MKDGTMQGQLEVQPYHTDSESPAGPVSQDLFKKTSLSSLPIIYSYRRPNVSHVHYGTNTMVAIHGPKTLKDVWYGGGANLLPDT